MKINAIFTKKNEKRPAIIAYSWSEKLAFVFVGGNDTRL